MEQIEINTKYITLDQFLKFVNVVSSGGEGKMMINEGLVIVNGVKELRRGRKLYPGDEIKIEALGSWNITRTED